MTLLVKDAPKGKKVAVPQGTKVLPPKDNERVVNVKTNKFRDVTCVKYATTSRVSLNGICAPLGQV
jgi:carbohydrate-binding DOMON domain-containing protein